MIRGEVAIVSLFENFNTSGCLCGKSFQIEYQVSFSRPSLSIKKSVNYNVAVHIHS
jgi:hypothetical protein